MTKRKKLSLVTVNVFAVLTVAVIMTVVGVCIAWTVTRDTSLTLSDWLELNEMATVDGLSPNAAFAIMTVIFTGLTAAAFALEKLTSLKAAKFATLACAALLIICSVITLITAYTFTGNLLGGYAHTVPAAGVWLVFTFGFFGGVSAIVGEIIK